MWIILRIFTMSIRLINKKYFWLTIALFNAITLSAKNVYSIPEVKIDSSLSMFISKAIIPYSKYILDLSDENDSVRSVLFLQQNDKAPDNINEHANTCNPLFNITLTNTRHLRNGILSTFNPCCFTKINNTLIFIDKSVTDLDIKPLPSSIDYLVHKKEIMYDYDPQQIVAYKINGTYKFYIYPFYLESYANKYFKKNGNSFAMNDSLSLSVIELQETPKHLINKHGDKNMAYFINGLHEPNISIIPINWVNKSILKNCAIAFPVSDNLEQYNIPMLFVNNSIAKKLGIYLPKKIPFFASGNVPKFVTYIDFPTYKYSAPLMEKANAIPSFPGGITAMEQWLEKNLIYPDDAKNEGIQGTIEVKFTVEKDGCISNAYVNKGKFPSLNDEALRLVNLMPKWIPGEYNGNPVRSYYTLPIKFRLH